jgi:hypothetical protein
MVLSATVIAAMVWLAGCSSDNPVTPSSNPVAKYSSEVPVAWDELQMVLVQTTSGFSPPVAARAFGYTGVALYEALVPGMSGYQSLSGQLNEMPAMPQPQSNLEYHWPSVANGVLAAITRHLFAETTAQAAVNAQKIDSLENAFTTKFRNEAGADTAMLARSLAYGKQVAEAIFEWSKTDGGHEGYKRNTDTTFVMPTGPDKWVPTPGGAKYPLQPHWGANRPFVLPKGNPNMFSEPGDPLAYSEDPASAFYKDGIEVYNTVKNLTPDQRAIALFWSDDAGTTCTPPGHSVSIMCQCMKLKGNTHDVAAEACAKIGIAVNDAFIACWESKFKYNLLRPITYIQRVIDPSWNSASALPLGTPPFPEYTSGHSVQSGAAAEVLTALYGPSFSFTDRTHELAGKGIRTFSSFYEFADEAAISRLYGGIHYRAAIERGVEQGKKIGQRVNALKFKR